MDNADLLTQAGIVAPARRIAPRAMTQEKLTSAGDTGRKVGLASFDRPTSPAEVDEHTSVLCHFDGDGAATVFGQKVALSTP